MNWKSKDYETACDFLANCGEEAALSTVLDTGRETTVVLPSGLPALGTTFHGIFMAAPLVIFCMILALLPVVGFLKGWPLDATSVLMTGGCVALIYGLIRAFALMLGNRDLFPRRHFVTLSPHGLAGHFASWQIPSGGRGEIEWKALKSIERGRVFFLPALFLGVFSADALIATSRDGNRVFMPVYISDEMKNPALKEIEDAIDRHRKGS